MAICFKKRIYPYIILGDPGADSRGEKQIKRAKSVRAEAWCEQKPGASESLQDGREQPLGGYL